MYSQSLALVIPQSTKLVVVYFFNSNQNTFNHSARCSSKTSPFRGVSEIILVQLQGWDNVGIRMTIF